ncbi:flagellar hook-associated protein FlgK [Halomonas saccharevitans]|uniref:Flagellar hook-associated protein 1 n=1 Tax=Halomonas saccharevitans TaxID=416872 RepID=A0ABU3NDH9_9GAMM|nr:flagellar hook-associated protein FlgK [Halomonas saccharevitans]MDT8879192.1 flagellar hook-associated protein FlgK [Halomonas saccharevitans]
MSIFSTGLSGLNAAQNALATTSNNISNVFTPGYNREVAILGQTSTGGGGVQVNDIQRQFNDYVASQLNAATSKSSALATYSNQVGQIDSLLADREAGLAPLMQNFFSSLEDLASAPSDPAARQGVLGSADTLSAQFRSFDGYLQDMQEGINGQIADEVTQINNTTEQLAGLNREIALARARSGEAPNGLLNQRDQLVNELSERMDVRLNIQDGKTYNVSLPNGQPLVAGTQQFKLEAMDSPADPQRTVLGYRDSGGSLVALDEDIVTGGTLGGLMDFRAETLDKTQNQIGQMAVSLAVAFNQQHANGVDLDGEQGGAFFDIGQPRSFSAEGNDGSAKVADTAFDTANIDQLKATDYTVRAKTDSPSAASDFEIVRKDTGAVLDSSDPESVNFDGNELSFGGVTLTFDDTANMAQNDRFEVQPVRRAAGNLESAISDLDKIAAGALFTTGGDMSVEKVQAQEGAFQDGASYDLELDENGALTFTDAIPGQVEVNGEVRNVDGSGEVQDAAGTAAASLKAGDVVTVDGVSFTIGELPTAGKTSSLTLEEGTAGSGDNRNALALQDLQDKNVVSGSASLSGAYGAMVSDVGNRTNIVQVNLDAQQGLTDQLKAVQQSESGVNLDEEAANLIRYQQFYQANAKVIDTGKTVIDTILGLRN